MRKIASPKTRARNDKNGISSSEPTRKEGELLSLNTNVHSETSLNLMSRLKNYSHDLSQSVKKFLKFWKSAVLFLPSSFRRGGREIAKMQVHRQREFRTFCIWMSLCVIASPRFWGEAIYFPSHKWERLLRKKRSQWHKRAPHLLFKKNFKKIFIRNIN